MTLSEYQYQLNGGPWTSLLLATSGNITDAAYVVGTNTVRFRGYDAVAGVAGRASATVTFERAASDFTFLRSDGTSAIFRSDGTSSFIRP